MTMKPDMNNELRGLVREVLRDVMADRSGSGPSIAEVVRITNDLELAAFVIRVTEPATTEKIRSGKLRFTLNGKAVAATTPSVGGVLTGVITEQKIDKLAGTGSLMLGPGAVLTPLARDRARRLGLKIERRL